MIRALNRNHYEMTLSPEYNPSIVTSRVTEMLTWLKDRAKSKSF
jgi:hypothetical protein